MDKDKEKNNKLNLWPKTAHLGRCFRPLPRKSLRGSPLHILSQEMRHIDFFLGAENGGFWVGAKKIMLKKFMCFFSVPYGSFLKSAVWISHACSRAIQVANVRLR